MVVDLFQFVWSSSSSPSGFHFEAGHWNCLYLPREELGTFPTC